MRVGEYSVVVSQLRDRFDAELLASAKITGISNYAVGFDNIDVDAATARGITVANTPGVLTNSTADIAMLLILSTARRAIEADHFVRSGAFTGWEPELLLGSDVSGQVLGLAGFGRIARATASRALGFGMTVKFCPRPPSDREVTDEELGEFAGRVEHVSWEELVATSDFLSLHVPLSESTHHLVDERALWAMKNSAILINTARGPVVDEAELVRALRERVIAGAGLDVRARARAGARSCGTAQYSSVAPCRECDGLGPVRDGSSVRRECRGDGDGFAPTPSRQLSGRVTAAEGSGYLLGVGHEQVHPLLAL